MDIVSKNIEGLTGLGPMTATTSDTRRWHPHTAFGISKRHKSGRSHPDATTHRKGVMEYGNHLGLARDDLISDATPTCR